MPRAQPERPERRPDKTLTQEEAAILTVQIEYQQQRLADLGTRLRALHDADAATIQAELDAITAMEPNDGSWQDYAQAAVYVRDHFLERGHQLLRDTKRREATSA